MKKLVLLICTLAFVSYSDADAQIWSAQLQYHNGFATIYGPPNWQGIPTSIYQGNVVNGVAHGFGTWYFANGEVFQGYFQGGWPNGTGIYFSYQGYTTGCWSRGTYVGACRQQVQQFFQQRRYGGADDALANVSSTAPRGARVDAGNMPVNPSSSAGRRMYGSGGF